MTTHRASKRRSCSRRPTTGRRRWGRLGYTVVEIMMALAVLSIGATGVIAMQKAALIGNVRARNLTTANAIASTWIERLRVDGLQWVIDQNGQSTINSTRWLQAVGNDFPNAVAPENIWLRPQDFLAEDISAQADVLGRDTFNDAEAGFCTHIKLTQITENTIRAEVRVFWLRHGNQGVGQTGPIGGPSVPLCANNPGYVASVSTAAALPRYHFVYVTTAIIRGTGP